MASSPLMRPLSRGPDAERAFRAVNEGRCSDLSTLLQQGFDVESRDKDGHTVLHMACKAGDSVMVDTILQAGAQVDSKDTWASWTPLHHAVWHGRKTVAQLLLTRSANKNARDKEGQTPLHLAAMRGRLVEALLLLDVGATLDLRDQKLFTPLHSAVISGSFEVLHLLIQRGADKSVRNKEGKTPAQMADNLKRHDIVELFFKSRPVGNPHPNDAGIMDLSAQLQVMSKVEANIAKAREELGLLKAADKLRRLEESLHKALSEGLALRKMLEDREEKLQVSLKAENAAQKKASVEEAKRTDEEQKRKEADSRRRVLEKQMADAMHSLTEGEQCRAEMEKQLKLEVAVREFAESRALEAEVKRSDAETRLNAEVKARQEIEAKLKEKQDYFKQVSGQFTDLEKARMEDMARCQQFQKQKTEAEEQLKEMVRKKQVCEESVKEEQEKRQKTEERLRKAEAYAKEEQRLRKEEEKARKEAQNLLVEETKLRTAAEAKFLDESKRRARAEIKAMAEEGKRTELAEKMEERELKMEKLQAELGKLRMLLSILPAQDPSERLEPGTASLATMESSSSQQALDASAELMPSSLDTAAGEEEPPSGADGAGTENPLYRPQTDPSSNCVAAFQQLLQAATGSGRSVSPEDVTRFVEELNKLAPDRTQIWGQVFQCLQGDSVLDMEELKKERDALRATLKEMAQKAQSDCVSSSPNAAQMEPVSGAADPRVKKLELDLRDAQRKKEEAEIRCMALEQMITTGATAKPVKAGFRSDAAGRNMASVLERFTFKAKVHDAPDQK